MVIAMKVLKNCCNLFILFATSSISDLSIQQFPCKDDICNRNGVYQYCSEVDGHCRDCKEVFDRCGKHTQPKNCTVFCAFTVDIHIKASLESDCPKLKKVEHGTHNGSANHRYGDVVLTICNDGYKLTSTGTITCNKFGEWSHDLPSCKEIECPSISAKIANGAHNGSNSHRYGDVVGITCNDGFKRTSAGTTTCNGLGRWSHDLPSCTEIECPPLLAKIKNGAHNGSNSHRYGAVVGITCNDGFTPTSAGTTTCNEYGEWSNDLPSCTERECLILGKVENGRHNGSAMHLLGDVVEISCNDGFKLANTGTNFCTELGEWRNDLHSCKDAGVDWKTYFFILLILALILFFLASTFGLCYIKKLKNNNEMLALENTPLKVSSIEQHPSNSDDDDITAKTQIPLLSNGKKPPNNRLKEQIV